jgi:peptidoglycan/LPS O-acetylase OafA/YrhL
VYQRRGALAKNTQADSLTFAKPPLHWTSSRGERGLPLTRRNNAICRDESGTISFIRPETSAAALQCKRGISVPIQAQTLSTGRYYRPELDVLRFVAFLLVFLSHTLPSASDPRVQHLLHGFAPAVDTLTDGCGFGLSLFFVLSAFLICELLVRERESTGTAAVRQFYIRRILRIWPLYYLALALGTIVEIRTGSQPGGMVGIGWFAIFMGAWYINIHGWISNPVVPLWSVSVEEQFYLFAPWIVKYFSRKSLYGFCTALALVSNSWLYCLGKTAIKDYRVWTNSFVQFECFAAGILICLFLRGRLPRMATWQRVSLVAFSLCCLFVTCYELHPRFGFSGTRNPGSWPLMWGYALTSLSCSLLLVAFLGVDAQLFPKWAIYLGRISYGLYVFHGFAIHATDYFVIGYFAAHKSPLIRLLQGPIYILNIGLTFGLTILMAALSYRFFETPFLKMKKRHAVIESQPITGTN